MRTGQIVKAFIVDDDNKILLLRRSKTAPRRPLQWDLPGGFVDDDDNKSYAAACAREVVEEAGLEVRAEDMELVYAESDISTIQTGGREHMAITWLNFLTHIPDSATVKLSSEHDQFQWVDLDEAIEIVEYDRQLRVLEYIRDNKLLA